MGNEAYPVQCSATATTTLKSCFLYGICINKVLTGTVTIKDSAATVGTIAASTAAGMYHAIPNGVRYAALTIVLSGADDVTAFIKVA
jgi:hypothetical protein